MESELIPLFPTPLYCATLNFEKDEDFDQYIRQLEYARYPDDTGDVSVNKNILLEPEFAELKEEIDKHMNNFYYALSMLFQCLNQMYHFQVACHRHIDHHQNLIHQWIQLEC